MNDELERIWKEVVVAQSGYYCGIFLHELRNVTKNSAIMAGVPAKI
jgi:hypothetical protein